MFSILLNTIPGLNIDPTTGKIAGGAVPPVKQAVKRAVKKASEAAATVAAEMADSAPNQQAEKITQATVPAAAPGAAQAAAAASSASVDEAPSAFAEWISELDPTLTAIVVGLLIIIAFYIYRRRFSSTGQVGSAFLLLGPMGVGKTVLYYRLKQGIPRETYTSIKQNEETFAPKQLEGQVSPARFVDLPGHASQRVKLENYKSVTKGIIFVVDGSNPSNLSGAAQYLYTLLVDPIFVARRTPVFIAINKTDAMRADASSAQGEGETGGEEEDAAAVNDVANKLEQLLDKTRNLQSGMQDISGTDGEARVHTLGTEGKPFSFSDSVCPISVGGISAAKGHLDPLLTFLQSH